MTDKLVTEALGDVRGAIYADAWDEFEEILTQLAEEAYKLAVEDGALVAEACQEGGQGLCVYEMACQDVAREIRALKADG